MVGPARSCLGAACAAVPCRGLLQPFADGGGGDQDAEIEQSAVDLTANVRTSKLGHMLLGVDWIAAVQPTFVYRAGHGVSDV